MLRNHLVFISSGLLALAFVITPSTPASACSGPFCSEGSFIPGKGTVPASLPGIAWRAKVGAQGNPSDVSGVTMARVTASGEEAVAINVEVDPSTNHYIVKPTEALEADADYVLRGADYCVEAGQEGTPTEATLHTSAAAPLPTSLGSLSVGAASIGELSATTVSGSCTSPITAAQATLSLALSADAAPFEEALILKTIVDGEPWSHGKLLYAQCASDDDGTDPGLTEGEHSVWMEAKLPGTAGALSTEPIAVNLQCAPDVEPEPIGSGKENELDVRACSLAGAPKPSREGALGLWFFAAGGAAALALARRARRR
jgi:hypothetical protein